MLSGWIWKMPMALSHIDCALDFFHMYAGVINIIQSYFADLKICHSLCNYTTSWQKLGRGIAMGGSVSSILFIAAFEIILIGERTMEHEIVQDFGCLPSDA